MEFHILLWLSEDLCEVALLRCLRKGSFQEKDDADQGVPLKHFVLCIDGYSEESVG